MNDAAAAPARTGLEIRVRGTVQGVGFRPTVWRLARDCGLTGEVLNDSAGVLIHAAGSEEALARFLERLRAEAPPLARIEDIETRALAQFPDHDAFLIVKSVGGETRTRVTPDAATCPACRAEVLDPGERRHRYPFTNCTHCGPRLSIVRSVPYDRANTTMAAFPMCEDCAREYADPADRRFHAQPIACHACGPRVWIENPDGQVLDPAAHGARDPLALAARLLGQGRILALRGLGGFHLACDATDADAVERLRSRKRRYGKPFALMARDLTVVSRYCALSNDERSLLESPQAPIVLLDADGPEILPEAVAPGLRTLGFMLPYTPLHRLLLEGLDRPLVMTSGNLSHEPQIIDSDEARTKLTAIADLLLLHDREIANRIDDSVVRVMDGTPRFLRRARGYAPRALRLPGGFDDAPDLLAYGGELKSTFCVLKDGAAIVSQHQGDLEDLATFEDYQKNLELYAALYDHQPELLACDLHPEYLSAKLAKERTAAGGPPLVEIQHHHAHVASCLAENGIALDAAPVLGVVIDGLGFGADGTLWGGEFLLADYRGYRRLACLRPVPMIGGTRAILEPWRNTYAHLLAALGWEAFRSDFAGLELHRYLASRPLATLDRMLERGLNVPPASSCGRLFDAVSAAVGLCRDRALFEGQGAIELEMAADARALSATDEQAAYPFAIIPHPDPDPDPDWLDPAPLWRRLLEDVAADTPVALIAARFHRGLAAGIAAMVAHLAEGARFGAVALSGGCFQNKVLLEEVSHRISNAGLKCLTQAKMPANDGGLALGQAAIAACHRIDSSA